MFDFGGKITDNDLRLSGIHGWLAFFAVSLILSTLLSFSNIVNNYLPYTKDNSLSLIYSNNKPIFHILIFEMISSLLLCGFLIYLCIIFFKKSKKFPKLIIYYTITNCIVAFVGFGLYLKYIKPLFGTENFQAQIPIFQIVYAVIWGMYFIKSKRVKNTFIF
jgi:hypothetical protein